MADLQAAIGAPIQRPKIIPPGKPMRSGDVELPQSRLTMGKNAAALRDSDVGDRPCTSARAACVGDVVRLVGLSRHDLNERVAVVVRINDRVSVELQDGRRLAIKPAKLQLVDLAGSERMYKMKNNSFVRTKICCKYRPRIQRHCPANNFKWTFIF